MIQAASRPARVLEWAAIAVSTATLFIAGDVLAQNPVGFGPMRTVTPNPEYSAGGLHRLFFGDHNRELWTLPIRVPELDLGTFAGGLTPLQRGGGFQTRSLRLRGADGREYAFRSVDKDPSSVLPAELRETLVRDLIQDQTSAGHPTAPLVVAPLLEAVGVLHPDPFLVIMPDDARLGAFRAEFANVLGFIEERPEDPTEEAPGFAGASNVVGTERLLERMQEDGERIDERAFLTARLVDMFLGDWDRHRDQWRWARFGGGRDALWQPIARDRDQAFVRLDGLVLRLARRSNPQLVSFGAEYPSITGLTWNGRELDRRFLSGLEWPVWDSVATFLQSRLTDDVIAAAVRRLPAEHHALHAATLTRRLIERRNELRRVAHRFYGLLATEVDVHASDAAEVVTAERADDQGLVVTIARRNGGPPRYQRRFLPSETDEVRLFLYGGADSVSLRGSGGDIRVRVIGGEGDDIYENAMGRSRFYDQPGEQPVIRGRSIDVDNRPFDPENPSPARPLRDWGAMTLPLFFVGGSPDLGVVISGGLAHTNFGFRKKPYAVDTRLLVGYATTAQAFRAELLTDVRRENSDVHVRVLARASGLEILRFHGFGNDTEIDGTSDFYKVRQYQYALEPELVLPFSDRLTLAFGPAMQYADTRMDEDRFIDTAQPYGTPTFGQVAARGRVTFDARNRPSAATNGFLFNAGGSLFPALWDVESAFGELHGEASTYLTAGAGPTLALRAGGKKLWGTYPFHEAAYIGDASTVRLGRKERFGGDAEVHATAELRQRLGRITIVLPSEIGVLGFADIGRVYFEGDDSNTWHPAFGGGLFLAPIDPTHTLSLSVAKSEERVGIYVQAGFSF
jgi:hypothetical protein